MRKLTKFEETVSLTYSLYPENRVACMVHEIFCDYSSKIAEQKAVEMLDMFWDYCKNERKFIQENYYEIYQYREKR